MNSPVEYPAAAYTVSYITSELISRLLDVQEEEAQAGKGREAIMKWKTDEQRWKNAWSTPTGALTDSSSPPLSKSQSPLRSDIATPGTQFPESPLVEIHTTSSTSTTKRTYPSQNQSHTTNKPRRSCSAIAESTEKLPPDIRSPVCEQNAYSIDPSLNGSRLGQALIKRLFRESSHCSEYEQERLTCSLGAKRPRVGEGDIARRIADEDQPKATTTPDLSTTTNSPSSVLHDPIYKANTTTRIPLVQIVKLKQRTTALQNRRSRRLQRLPPELQMSICEDITRA